MGFGWFSRHRVVKCQNGEDIRMPKNPDDAAPLFLNIDQKKWEGGVDIPGAATANFSIEQRSIYQQALVAPIARQKMEPSQQQGWKPASGVLESPTRQPAGRIQHPWKTFRG